MKGSHLVIIVIVVSCAYFCRVNFTDNPGSVSKETKKGDHWERKKNSLTEQKKTSVRNTSKRNKLSEGEKFLVKIPTNGRILDPVRRAGELELLILDYKRGIQDPKIPGRKSDLENIRMLAEAYSDILDVKLEIGKKEASEFLKSRELFLRMELVELVNTYCSDHQVGSDVLLRVSGCVNPETEVE